MRRLLLAPLLLALAGCDGYHYHAGRLDESRTAIPAALAHYEAFLRARPEDARAAELHVRAGRLYAQMERCDDARRHFEAAARDFSKVEPWATRGRVGVMSCPDYFPLEAGRAWVYGDSASGGRAMRLQWTVTASSSTGIAVRQTLFAGPRQLKSVEVAYDVSGWTVWQRDGAGRFPFLEYPFAAGRSWKARRDGRWLTYRVESVDARALTAAGSFERCLKVRESDPTYRTAWKYDYYCPGVGRALTTVAGADFENPNTELLSFTR